MKLKTLVHRRIRKYLYRAVRYHWVTERVLNLLGRSPILDLPEIGARINIAPDEVIVDCGANVGNITSRFARSGAEIYAFEPNPEVFAILAGRFRGNPRVHCINKGVMEKPGKLPFYLPKPGKSADSIDRSVAASFHAGSTGGMAADNCIEVECIDLVEFIRSLNRPIRLLKLDIEGAEPPVLNALLDSGLMPCIGLVVAETHEKQIPALAPDIAALQKRIDDEQLHDKIRLDWV